MGTKPTKEFQSAHAWPGLRALWSLMVASWFAGVHLVNATPPTNQPPAQAADTTHSANQPAPRGPGITYEHDDVDEVPWSIHVAKVDRSRADLGLETTMGAGNRFGMGLVSDQ